MRILLIHPDDSPRVGPWTRQGWDLIVDLGQSSETTANAWGELFGCPVVRLEGLRRSVEDPSSIGESLRVFSGVLMDRCGIDWWEFCLSVVYKPVELATLLLRLARNETLRGDLYATRRGWPVDGLAKLLGRDLQVPFATHHDTPYRRVKRLNSKFRRLSLGQAWEVFLDKYDADYRCRKIAARPPSPSQHPVVLLPSAYTNVSRSAAAYARLLPEQEFLMVGTRRSAFQFEPPSNVRVAGLPAYSTRQYPRAELNELLAAWTQLRQRLQHIPELRLVDACGLLEGFPRWFTNGLAIRDAWNNVLDREPVAAVLCGDESNAYTRLPVYSARIRGIRTVSFHHGALDGHFLLKRLAAHFYLAKGEMERDYLTRICKMPADRIIVASSATTRAHFPGRTHPRQGSYITLFSEPYETMGGRPEEVYREVLPALCRLAADHQQSVVVKLHPFENLKERSRILRRALNQSQVSSVRLVDGPLNDELLEQTWFGMTIESTAALNCHERGVPCFLCGWLSGSPLGYVEQYERFGVGRLLRSAEEIANIPQLISEVGMMTAASPGVKGSSHISALRRALGIGRLSPLAGQDIR